MRLFGRGRASASKDGTKKAACRPEQTGKAGRLPDSKLAAHGRAAGSALLVGGLHALVMAQDALADAQVLGGDLQQLIGGQEFQAAL